MSGAIDYLKSLPLSLQIIVLFLYLMAYYVTARESSIAKDREYLINISNLYLEQFNKNSKEDRELLIKLSNLYLEPYTKKLSEPNREDFMRAIEEEKKKLLYREEEGHEEILGAIEEETLSIGKEIKAKAQLWESEIILLGFSVCFSVLAASLSLYHYWVRTHSPKLSASQRIFLKIVFATALHNGQNTSFNLAKAAKLLGIEEEELALSAKMASSLIQSES